MNSVQPPTDSGFSTLRRFARNRVAEEFCELCSCSLESEHGHLLETARRRLLCACEACVILFGSGSDLKYKRVPRRVLFLRNFQMEESQWDSLMIPIGMAFFFHSSSAGKVITLYPSPAGAIESLLSCEAWAGIVADNPVLHSMQA